MAWSSFLSVLSYITTDCSSGLFDFFGSTFLLPVRRGELLLMLPLLDVFFTDVDLLFCRLDRLREFDPLL